METLKIWISKINYTKHIAKEKRHQRIEKSAKKSLDEEDNLSKYDAIRNELDTIYDDIAESIHITSKCDWYGHSKNSTKFCFN